MKKEFLKYLATFSGFISSKYDSAREWCTALSLTFLIGFLWLSLIIVKCYITIPVTLVACFRDTDTLLGKTIDWKGWRYNIWIADDQNVNAVLGGDRDISISSRIGYNALLHNSLALKMQTIVDLGFYLAIGQENHCIQSIEKDENHNKNWGG